MKVVIQSLDSKRGYMVLCEDGREFIVKDINEAIELKNKLQENVQDTK